MMPMRMMNSKVEVNNINGILLINKPAGMTSNAVLQQVKRLYGAKKAGHTGSLDPMATGMLPICFGEATKFCQYLLDADKCYEVTGRLGIKTTTGDAMGEIIAQTEDFNVSKKYLQNVLSDFLGPVQQVPPMFSALKYKGQPLYKYARAGIDIERKSRQVHIHQLQLNHFDGKQLFVTVTCTKGTYIRSLIEDIGERLGSHAHVTRLHRLYTAGFDNEAMFTIDELQDQSAEKRLTCLLPPERAISYLPELILSNIEISELRQGKTLQNAEKSNTPGCIRLYDDAMKFIGLGDLQDTGLLKVRRLMSH